jgi:hypothetical protein
LWFIAVVAAGELNYSAREAIVDIIAEHRLVATFPDSGPTSVVVRLGRPYAHPNGDHACPVQTEGLRLLEGPSEIFGVGTWHALMLGLKFLRSMLATEAERGAVFHWEGGEQRRARNQRRGAVRPRPDRVAWDRVEVSRHTT